MNWQQSKREAEEYARLLYRIVRRSYSLPIETRERSLDLWANQAAERMILQRLYNSARTWRQASKEVIRGADIYRMLQNELSGPVGERVRELVSENAKLIRSLPGKVAEEVAQQIATAAQEGRRAESSEHLTSHIARWHSRLIARTETAKAQSALTQARSEDLGVDYYVWRTSQDARVRISHRRMEGVLVRFDDPPSPEALVGERSTLGHYNSGNAPNCRCYAEPLLRTSQISWPHRAYMDGALRMITLAQFRRMNDLPRRETRIGIAA